MANSSDAAETTGDDPDENSLESTEDEEEKKETPAECWKRWSSEMTAARKEFNQFHKQGKKTLEKFLDSRTQEQDEWGDLTTRLNLFNSNVVMLMCMLNGGAPKVEVKRTFADADDDAARVAGLMLTRILAIDIEEAGEDMASVFRNGLQDRLLPGLGTARVQYQCSTSTSTQPAIIDHNTGQELAPAVQVENLDTEWTDIVYTHWKDVLWAPSRTYPEIPWKAYRSWLTKDEFKDRFPDIDIKKITFSNKGPVLRSRGDRQEYNVNPQVEVWEIWDKMEKCVYWWTEGFQEILDEMEDPLELKGFWPEAPPMIANVTTSKYIPKADYEIAKDLYREIDKLQTRISLLTDACKLIGIYDKSQEAVKRIFTEGVENDLIPVDNWAMFAEKGGLKGVIDWVPIEAVVNAINILTAKQQEKIQQLYQITGMNAIMRGDSPAPERTSATRDMLTTNFGSIRVEALQNDFARWVGDLQALKVEIICKHYSPDTIVKQSNIMITDDGKTPGLVQAAIDLIKKPDDFRWRVQVRPETLAIADYNQLKQDRTEYINALALFMQSAAPLLQLDPGSLPSLLKLLKWGLSGFRGSSEIEGVIDEDIKRIEKAAAAKAANPQPQQEDPAVQAEKAAAAARLQEIQAEMAQSAQNNQQKMTEAAQAHQQKMDQSQSKFALEMTQMREQFALEMKQHTLEMVEKVREALATTKLGMAEKTHAAAVSMESSDHAARRDNGSTE